MEVDKLDAGDGFELDDKLRARNDKEEDDAPGATGGNDDRQMEMVVNEKDVKPRAVVVNKRDAGSSARFENKKDEILSKEASVNSQLKKIGVGLHALGLGKKQPPVCAGLSYLESQEPGEQSQADALNIVDKFVWLNTTVFSQHLDPRTLPAVTSCGPPSARRPQNLAQLVESVSPTEKTGIFDWVDSQNDEIGGQLFGKNGRDVLVSTNRGHKVKSESKQIGRRSSKGKNNSSIQDAKAEKIGKDKSRILLPGLQKLAESNLKKASNLSHGRQNKVKEVKGQGANATVSNRANKSQADAATVRFSERLRPGEEQNHEKKLTGAADKKHALVEKMLLNSEVSDQQKIKSCTFRDSIDLQNSSNDIQLAAEVMQIMHSETSPNQATEENIHRVAESGCTVATRGKGRRVHWADDVGKLQKMDEGRKDGRPRKSKHDEDEKLESNVDPMGSEARKENQDMVKDYRNLDKGEIETSPNSSGAGEKWDILEDSSKVVKRRSHLATDDPTKLSGEVQSVGEALEGMPNAGTPVIHSTRQINRKKVENQKPAIQSNLKSHNTKEEDTDFLITSANIVRNKRKRANVEETSYKQSNSVSTRRSSNSQPTKEVKSDGADAEGTCQRADVVAISPPQDKDLLQEENLKLDKQNVSQSPKTHDENRDTLPKFANAARRNRNKTNKEESEVSKSVDSLLAEATDRDMLQKIGEKTLRITRQSMRNSRPETSSPISALTTIDGDKPESNNMVPESGAQGRKSRRKNTINTTPNGSELANQGSLARLSKDEVQPKDTSVDVKSPFTWQTPDNVNSISQEPGEQSQADTLNMVEKLAWLNTTVFSQHPDPRMLPAVTSCGPQSLAQLVESINPNEKTGIFDWVDSQNDEGGGQFFGKNGRDVLASTKRGDKVKSESKQIGRRSSKSKNNSSVEHAQTEKIGKDKSKILLQGLQKLAGSSASKSNLKNASNLSHGRQNKVKEVKGPGANVTVSNRANKSQSAADTLRFSERLRSGEEQNHEKKLTDAADKKNALVEKMLLNSGEDSDQQERNSPTCRDSIDLHNIGIDTQLAAEAMQIMHSETSPNQATKENVHIVAESGCTKSKESRKGNRRVSGTGTHKASEDHTSRKRTLPDTDHESNENCAKQSKISRSSVATRGKSRGIHGAEDEGKLQKKDEGRKHGRPRKSKHDENEKLEANIDPIGSEARKENQDMVKDYRKVVRRKGSNMEETLKPAREVESTGKDTRVGRLTRQTRNLDQGEIREIETSLNSSRAGRKENRDMVKDSREVVMRKGSNMEETLQPAREVQSAGKDARVGRLTSQTRNLNKGEISQRETSPNSSGAGRKENQDMVKDSKKVVMRKGSNVEETLKPAREVQSAGKDTRVRCLTRQTRNLNQGEICETETSPNGSGAGEKGDILEVSAKIVKRKRQLAPNDPTKPSVEDQSVGEALEEMPNAGTPAIHSTRKINRKKVEKQKPAIQSNLKSPNTKEEDNDFLITSANIVRNKRKRANVEDTSYKQSNSVSTRRSSKSQPTKEVKSNGAHAEGTCPGAAVIAISPPQVKDLLQEENLKLDKQTVSQSPKTHNENRDTLPNFANTTRRKRSKTNKEESKLSKSILVEDSSLAEAADRDMLQKVGEKALRITRQSMRNSGPETSSPISALTTIDGDKPEINNMVPESGAQERKSRRRNTMLTTPSGSKLANHGSLARLSKVQPKNTSVDVKSPFTWQTPENVNSKSPATDGHGIETIHLSGKDVPKKGTPKSTLKRELDRLVATDSGQSPTAKDSARKRREPGSIRVLFSHSLDDDLVKQQKKILTRLGGQPTASPVDCTHFVTDKFVRTRNMLEAIAAGKPVVTHLWLESCGQASYFIDEKNYILRDEKKEKEIGFSMPASLASAQQKPLLQGKRVFVTPNTKPEQESIISLVKATNGQVLNGLKGAFSKKEENKESIIVISCEEDYGVCVPLLEKGARIYSSEFLLNGIVVQKLEFSRDQLFTDPVKQMRSSNMHLRQRT